jgi:hypothetical protein
VRIGRDVHEQRLHVLHAQDLRPAGHHVRRRERRLRWDAQLRRLRGEPDVSQRSVLRPEELRRQGS